MVLEKVYDRKRGKTILVSGNEWGLRRKLFREMFGCDPHRAAKEGEQHAKSIVREITGKYGLIDEQTREEIRRAAIKGYVHGRAMRGFVERLGDRDTLNVFVGRDALPLLILARKLGVPHIAFLGVSREIPGIKDLTHENIMAAREGYTVETALCCLPSARDVLHFGGEEIERSVEALKEILGEKDLKTAKMTEKQRVLAEKMEELETSIEHVNGILKEKTGKTLDEIFRPYLEKLLREAKMRGARKVRFVDQGYYGTHPFLIKVLWKRLGFHGEVPAETALLYAYREPANMHDIVHARIDDRLSGRDLLGPIFEGIPFPVDRYVLPNRPKRAIRKNILPWIAYKKGIERAV